MGIDQLTPAAKPVPVARKPKPDKENRHAEEQDAARQAQIEKARADEALREKRENMPESKIWSHAPGGAKTNADVNHLLEVFGQHLGIGKLKFNDNGVCRLVFDEKFDTDIEMTDDGAAFFIYAVVGKAPTEDNPAFYRELLTANLFGTGTGNGALALDASRNEIVLSRRFSQDLSDVNLFAAEVEKFVNHLELWTDRLRKNRIGQPAPAEPVNLPNRAFKV